MRQDTRLEGLAGFDPYDPEIQENPFAYFREAHRGCPVYHHVMPEDEVAKTTDNPYVAQPTTEFYLALGYSDVVDILQHHQEFPSGRGPGPEYMHQFVEGGMLQNGDPPHHTGQRRIVTQALSPRIVKLFEPRVRDIANELIDAFIAEGGVDMIPTFADRFPGMFFAEIIGVPRDNQANFKRWTEDIVAALGGDEEAKARSVVSLEEFMVYFLDQITKRRALVEAGEAPDDLLTGLITHDYEGRRFTDIELVFCLHVLFVGGNETTSSAIGNALWLLCEHPEAMQALRDDQSLIPNAVEEILRYESPVQCLFRTAAGEREVSGVTIGDDTKIGVSYLAANRDANAFPEADRFDISRDPKDLRRHVAFGFGIHACPGAALARIELRIALETLLGRLPNLRLDPEHPPVRRVNLITRGFGSLPLVWDQAS